MERSGQGGRTRRYVEALWSLLRCECYDCRAIRWAAVRRLAGVAAVLSVVAVQLIRR